MNWRRGLVRLWLALSLGWIAGVGVLAWGHEQTTASRDQALKACFEASKAEGTDIFSCFSDETIYPALGSKTVGEYTAYAFLPPLVTLVLGLIGAWLVRKGEEAAK
jgi:hypothetical protein